MFVGEITTIVAYTLILVVVIRATIVVKSEEQKQKKNIIPRGSVVCLHLRERWLKLSLFPKQGYIGGYLLLP